MIMFKTIKDAYVLKCIDGNPAPAQQLKIALSRSALPALTTGTPGPVRHTLCSVHWHHHIRSTAHPKVSEC